MDLEKRRKTIIEFVTDNPGCNQEDIVKHLAGKASRLTVLNTIIELEKENIIYWETVRENSRDHRFHVKHDNILVYVTKELEEFDKNFFFLLKGTTLKFDEIYMANKPKVELGPQNVDLTVFQPVLDALSQMVDIFYEFVDVYMLRCILKWPETVKKEDIIKKLYSILFSKIIDMQFRMSKILRSTKAGDFYPITQLSVYRRIYETEKFQRHLEKFNLVGIKGIDEVLDSLWDIHKDFRQTSFPEPWIYNWNFDYEKDSWKKLLDIQRKHPEQTYHNSVRKQLA